MRPQDPHSSKQARKPQHQQEDRTDNREAAHKQLPLKKDSSKAKPVAAQDTSPVQIHLATPLTNATAATSSPPTLQNGMKLFKIS